MKESSCTTRDLIGSTPLLDLSAYSLNPTVKILAKCEYLNPSGSIKDRIATHILDKAIKSGDLKPGMTVVAATSGNTGAAIAMACALRGYDYIVITNEKTSKEKVDAMRAYGGEVIVSPSGVSPDDPQHYQNIENKLCEENPGTYYGVDQYNNPYNADAYEATLGPEIWRQSVGAVTHFIVGGSTGGTVSGTGRYLKQENPDVRIVLADPRGSVFWDHVVNGVAADDVKVSKSWETEGVGKDSIPGCLDVSIVDGMVRATDEQAFGVCRELASSDGLLVGGSSGLNLHASRVLSGDVADDSVIVTVFPDNGVKYLSKIYNDDWLDSKKMGGAKNSDGNAERAAECEVYWRPDALSFAERKAAADAAAAAAVEGDNLWPEDETERELKFLEELAPKLTQYHRDSIKGDERVHSKLQSPEELAATFAAAGAPIDLAEGDAPATEEQLALAVQAVMDNSVRSSHPMFLNQLYAGVDVVALAGEWTASALNANVHTFEVAPVLTEIEKAVLAKTARMWLNKPGSKTTPPHDGLLVPGGSLANMYSMILARDRAEPEAKTKGASGNLVAFCSEQSHYSYKKSAMVMGLGMDNMIKVKCDQSGAMIPAELEKAVQEAKSRGKVPFYVGTTAGSTVLGAFDDYEGCADVCEKHDMWMHVDGAWGGAAALSPTRRHNPPGREQSGLVLLEPAQDARVAAPVLHLRDEATRGAVQGERRAGGLLVPAGQEQRRRGPRRPHDSVRTQGGRPQDLARVEGARRRRLGESRGPLLWPRGVRRGVGARAVRKRRLVRPRRARAVREHRVLVRAPAPEAVRCRVRDRGPAHGDWVRRPEAEGPDATDRGRDDRVPADRLDEPSKLFPTRASKLEAPVEERARRYARSHGRHGQRPVIRDGGHSATLMITTAGSVDQKK